MCIIYTGINNINNIKMLPEMNPYDNESIPDSSTKPCLLHQFHAIYFFPAYFRPRLIPAFSILNVRSAALMYSSSARSRASSISMAPFIVVIILSMP